MASSSQRGGTSKERRWQEYTEKRAIYDAHADTLTEKPCSGATSARGLLCSCVAEQPKGGWVGRGKDQGEVRNKKSQAPCMCRALCVGGETVEIEEERLVRGGVLWREHCDRYTHWTVRIHTQSPMREAVPSVGFASPLEHSPASPLVRAIRFPCMSLPPMHARLRHRACMAPFLRHMKIAALALVALCTR